MIIIELADIKRKLNTRKKSYLKFGMLCNFGGTGPENKLFSIFLIRVNMLKDIRSTIQ